MGKSNQNHFVDVLFSVKKRLSLQAEDDTEPKEEGDGVDSPGGAPAKKLKTSDKKLKQKGRGAPGKTGAGGKKLKLAAGATKPAKQTKKRPAK